MDQRTHDPADPKLYINRELSLLEFERRVLEQAKDRRHPLLERLRFLCITANNLDEFFEIRVAGLKQQQSFEGTRAGPDQLSPGEQLRRIAETVRGLVTEQYRLLNELLLPELEQEEIRFIRREDWTGRQETWIRRYFYRELVPVLTPIGLDPSHPFPRILNKSLNFLVSLEGTDAFGRDSAIAIVQAPRALPRIINIPGSSGAGAHDFVFLSSIIHAHVGDLFPGLGVTGCYQFRVTRNSDLFVDDEEVENLLRAMKGELLSRRYGEAVRLEIAAECPPELVDLLVREFRLTPDDIYRCTGPVNITRLMQVPELVDRADLKYPAFSPGWPRRLQHNDNLFDVIRRGDLLLHHPYQSFLPVVEFLRQAAQDPNVLVIKQTLYRAGSDSPIVAHLVEAARAGKEVVVVVELKARFDEAANIELATRLQEAGAHVVYGVFGHKTHSKMILVVRREGRMLRRYVHLGTGNYHPRTAKAYTDYGLFTSDNAIGVDVQTIFQQLTAPRRPVKLKKLLHSPFTLHRRMLELVDREAANAAAGKAARIMLKMNALTEVEVIKALYRASGKGVKIDLIIRGICALRPGIEGLSENIRVRSIIDRFLEHTRVFYFHNRGEPEVYLSSADWMDRNFFYRIETCFPVEDRRLRDRIIKECLHNYLSDNTAAWALRPDGSYHAVAPGIAKPRNAQQRLLQQLSD